MESSKVFLSQCANPLGRFLTAVFLLREDADDDDDEEEEVQDLLLEEVKA